jgi:hypothetical protein
MPRSRWRRGALDPNRGCRPVPGRDRCFDTRWRARGFPSPHGRRP